MVFLAVYPGPHAESGMCFSAGGFISNRVSSKYSLLFMLFKPEFACILPCHGAAYFNVDIKIFNRRNNLTLQLRIIFFTFAHICSLHPLNRQRLFMLCLVFFWGILSLIHFKKQATTGWLEAVVGTSWGRGDGALAAGAKASQSFRGRQIELSTQTYAVNARVNI